MSISFAHLANLDQIAPVRRSNVCARAGNCWRAIDVQPYGGVHLRILPDRGFDVLDGWYAGTPLHWVGPAGENGPSTNLKGHEWEDVFTGGLLATCGLANVGNPGEGCGLHGCFNHLSARDIKVRRFVENEDVVVRLSATIFEPTVDGALYRLNRTYEVRTGSGLMRVFDSTTNLSEVTAPAPLLYHLNFGWPLFDEFTRIRVWDREGQRVVEGKISDIPGGWERPGTLVRDVSPVTIEHILRKRPSEGHVRIEAVSTGLSLDIKWNKNELPRLNQWINYRPECGVVAIEPANCSTLGRVADRKDGRLSFLKPNQTRRTRIDLLASPLKSRAGM